MLKKSIWGKVLVASLLSCLIACSSGTSLNQCLDCPRPTAAQAEEIIERQIIPVVLVTGTLFDESLKSNTFSMGANKSTCEDLAYMCSTGTARICFGLNWFELEWHNCSDEGSNLDGTERVTIDSQASGHAELDLTFNENILHGTIGVELGESCIVETMSRFSVTGPISSQTMDAELSWCSFWPSGWVRVTLVGDDYIGLLFEMTLDGSAHAAITVSELTSGDLVMSCGVDLLEGKSTCEAIEF